MMSFFDFIPWIWLAISIICIVIELSTVGLYTIWFALGAIVMIFLSKLSLNFGLQIVLFLVISVILLLLTRPLLKKYLKKKSIKTNYEALIGQTAVVTKAIDKNKKGEIKIDGKYWTAKSLDESLLEEGTECYIQQIEGVTAVVIKRFV